MGRTRTGAAPLGAAGRRVLQRAVEGLDPHGEVVTLDADAGRVVYASPLVLHRTIHSYDGEEEAVRAYLVAWLCRDGGYSAGDIELEKEYNAGRASKPRLDILLKRADGSPYALVEVKAPEHFHAERDTAFKGQLFGLAPYEPAAALLVYATVVVEAGAPVIKAEVVDLGPGLDWETWRRERPHTNAIPVGYGQAVHEHLYNARPGKPDLSRSIERRTLERIRKRLHDVLWKGSQPDNEIYDYVVRLFLAKVHDERTTRRGDRYRFQVYRNGQHRESPEDTYARVATLYRDAYQAYLARGGNVTSDLDRTQFSADQLQFVVGQLQAVSLTSTTEGGTDVLAGFFEAITQTGFKQSKGLFFTHMNIAVFMVHAVGLPGLAVDTFKRGRQTRDRLPYLIDPSVGSGTFPLAAMHAVTGELRARRAELAGTQADEEALRRLVPEDNPMSWAETFVYGVDASELLAMATKVNMILHRDGQAHILQGDSLSPLDSFTEPMLQPTGPTNPGNREPGSRYGKPVSAQFDVVITNPPFSIELAPQTRATLEDTFELAGLSNAENLFLERWYQLLKPGGRLAAVMPESFFSTRENTPARAFLFDHFDVKAVVSLPRHAFEPWTPTRTSLLFARKKTARDELAWVEARTNAKAELVQAVGVARRRLAALRRALPGEGDAASPEAVERRLDDLRTALVPLAGTDALEEHVSPALPILLDGGEQANEQLAVTAAALGRLDAEWESFRRTVAASAPADFVIADVNDIGYKRTRRAERDKRNDLFVAVTVPDVGEESAATDGVRPDDRPAPGPAVATDGTTAEGTADDEPASVAQDGVAGTSQQPAAGASRRVLNLNTARERWRVALRPGLGTDLLSMLEQERMWE